MSWLTPSNCSGSPDLARIAADRPVNGVRAVADDRILGRAVVLEPGDRAEDQIAAGRVCPDVIALDHVAGAAGVADVHAITGVAADDVAGLGVVPPMVLFAEPRDGDAAAAVGNDSGAGLVSAEKVAFDERAGCRR